MRFRARLPIAAAFAGGYLLLSCSGTPITPANEFGTVAGTISSSLGGGIGSVSVVVTPTGASPMTAVTTSSDGAFTVPNVPTGTAGTGSISVSGIPQNCQAPGPKNYSGLVSGEKTTVTISAKCVTPADTLAVQVTSSLGGAVANVNVVVTPTDSNPLNGATTNGGGSATFTGVGLAGGSISLTAVPNNCVTPGPVTYTGKPAGGTVSVPVVLQCSATAGEITGTVLTSQGNVSIGAGVGVIVTPHGGTALPAVLTNSTGGFQLTGVPVADGTGSLTFTNLPSNCPTPATPTPYTGLTSNGTLRLSALTITCNPPTGIITGTVSSSLGGGIAGVTVIVTPNGGTAMAAVTTNSTGAFTVTGVAVGSGTGGGTGTVALNHLTANCTAPTTASNYTGLTNGTSVTVNITVTCTTPYGVIHGTVVTSWGEPIEGVVATATPTGGQPVIAQPSDSIGAFVMTVPVGPGTGQVTFAGTPVDCAVIPTQNYTGLTNVRPVALYVVPTCTLTGAILFGVNAETNLVSTSTANVTLVGPDSALTPTTMAVTQPGLINPLKPGTYSLKASTYETSDPTVPQIFYPDSITQFHVELPIDSTATPVSVGDVDTISVTYAWHTGTGELWVADSSTLLMAGFSGPQLRQGGSVSASTLIAQYTPVAPTGIAVDKDTRIWTSMGPTNQVIKWRDSAEYGGTAPSYVLLDVTAGVSNPQGLAFDKNLLLWVANAGNNSLIGINESGTVTATLTSTALNQPTGMAFDATGNLWVSNIGNSTIVEFTAAQLATAGSETPTVVLSATGSSLSLPTALAFDPSGNLWVTNSAVSTVVSFSTTSLATTGSPTPTVTITANSGSLQTPRALAFDFGGNLWVANEAANTVVEYTPAQLASGGSLSPTGSVNSPGGVIGAPAGLAFNPQPTNVPINGSRVVVVKPGVRKAPTKFRALVKRKKK